MADTFFSEDHTVNVVQPSPTERHSAAFLTRFLCDNDRVFDTKTQCWQQAETLAAEPAVLTLVAPALTLAMVASVINGLAPAVTAHRVVCQRFHGHFGEGAVSIDVVITDFSEARQQLTALSDAHQIDIALQRIRPSLSQPGLLVMDMDSTLIDMECIDEIAKLGGVGDKVADVTRKAMRGELDFRESLLTRVACLEGIACSELEKIRNAMPIMPGAGLLVQVLAKHQWKLVVASGGFTYFADHLAQRLGLDAAVSNTLDVHNGKLTGKITGDIVDAEKKAQTVRELADKWQIPHAQTVAMGDGANDLIMMQTAALGVACHAKPAVEARADVSVRRGGLHTLLYLLA